MELLLGKISNDALIVMSGDIYQIESIDFGNWFFYAKDIVKAKGASIELSSTWRTEKEELKGLWKASSRKIYCNFFNYFTLVQLLSVLTVRLWPPPVYLPTFRVRKR